MKKIMIILIVLLSSCFFNMGFTSVSANDWEQNYKYYTTGIVDGGAYRIKNVQTGLYMNLANDSTSPGTNILLRPSSLSESQMFYVKYLGENRYVFEPYNSSDVKFRVASSIAGTNLSLYTTSNITTTQRFRITAVNSNQYVIATNISSYTNVLRAKYDSSIGWVAVHDLKSTVSDNDMKWEFEKVDDRAYDNYNSYYIKDLGSNLYITVTSTTNGSTISLRPFSGGENQRFKKKLLNNGTGFGYYYISMLKTDTAIELSSNTTINLYDKENNQKFTETYDSGSGGTKLSTTVDATTKFISRGSSYTYFDQTCYNLSTSTISSLGLNFVFENAYNETPFLYNLNINTTYSRTTSNYSEQHIYVFQPEITGDYTFFVSDNIGDSNMVITDSNDVWIPGTVTNYSNGQRYRVTLQRNKIYYILVWDYSFIGNSYLLNCYKDLDVYIHGMNTSYDDGSSFDSRVDCAIPSFNLLNSYNYYDPIINTEAEMTSTFVRNVDPSTGLVPLSANLYVFTGHGANDRVAYSTGTSTSSGTVTRLWTTNLFDFNTWATIFSMDGNSFSAWVACETADGDETIAEAAWRAGSLCSLGFEDSIGANASNRFIVNMFEEIESGYSISQAVDRAHSGISFWFSGLGSARFFGDSSQVLKPNIPSTFSSMRSAIQENVFEYDLLNGYTFMYENNRGTLKRFVKLINGYVSDDYIDVYYEGFEIKGYYKSKSTYDNQLIKQMPNYSNIFEQDDGFSIASSIVRDGITYDLIKNTNTYEQIYSHNNNIVPLRFYVTEYTNSFGEKYLEINIVNVMTKSIISEEVIFE